MADDWRDRKACTWDDRDLFFPDRQNNGPPDYAPARRICARCEVVNDCLFDALLSETGINSRHGMRGGKNPSERERLQGMKRCVICDAVFVSYHNRNTCSEPCTNERVRRSHAANNARRVA